MALECDPPHFGDIGDRTESWEERERREEERLERLFEARRVPSAVELD